MKTYALFLVPFFGAAVVSPLACSSSSSDGGTTTTDASTGDSGGDSGGGTDSGIINDPQNCVPPGTGGNSNGIGGYCSPLGGQCDDAGPGGSPRICTADLTNTPAHAWFCTYPCDHSIDCGSGNVCFENDEGAGCVPTVCLALNADAGHIVPDEDAGDGGDGG